MLAVRSNYGQSLLSKTQIEWTGERYGELRAPALPKLDVDAPPEFKGHEGVWTLESIRELPSLPPNQATTVRLAGIIRSNPGELTPSESGPMPYLRRHKRDSYVIAPNDAAAFHSLSHALQTAYPNKLSLCQGRGNVLFTEGEPARGIYILLAGRATVSISSPGGKIVILRVAQSGDVLGLNSTLRNCAYDVTVQALESCHTDFVPRSELIALMERSQQCTQAVLLELSEELTELAERARSLLLSQTTSIRLAKLLLEWGARTTANGLPLVRIEKSFTQEEIAQMIGSSRETVTRLLTTLTRRQIIEITTDSILIHDWRALESAAEDK